MQRGRIFATIAGRGRERVFRTRIGKVSQNDRRRHCTSSGRTVRCSREAVRAFRREGATTRRPVLARPALTPMGCIRSPARSLAPTGERSKPGGSDPRLWRRSAVQPCADRGAPEPRSAALAPTGGASVPPAQPWRRWGPRSEPEPGVDRGASEPFEPLRSAGAHSGHPGQPKPFEPLRFSRSPSEPLVDRGASEPPAARGAEHSGGQSRYWLHAERNPGGSEQRKKGAHANGGGGEVGQSVEEEEAGGVRADTIPLRPPLVKRPETSSRAAAAPRETGGRRSRHDTAQQLQGHLKGPDGRAAYAAPENGR